MYKSYEQIIEKAKACGPMKIAVAVAQDADVLGSIRLAEKEGLAQGILVGDARMIYPLMKEIGLGGDHIVVDVPDEKAAALKAVRLVHDGEAQALMKGLINTSDFLKAVLDDNVGLRTGRLLSHLAAMEIPGKKKIIFFADTGMNVAPTLAEKKEILYNSLQAMSAMGIKNPKVAIVTANEQVNPKMPATTDACALVEMNELGEFPPAVIEGPIAMDVALDQRAAGHKKIDSEISGDVDLFLVPNLEAGNIVGKAIVYYVKAKMAGLILGAASPIILTSRAESATGKLNSIALACLVANTR